MRHPSTRSTTGAAWLAAACMLALLGVASVGSVAAEEPTPTVTFVDRTSGTVVFSYAHPIFWAPFTIVGDGRSAGVRH